MTVARMPRFWATRGAALAVACVALITPGVQRDALAEPAQDHAVVIAEPALGTPTLSTSALSDLVVHVEIGGVEDVTIAIASAFAPSLKPYLETKVHVDHRAEVVVPVDCTEPYASQLNVVVRDHAGRTIGGARVSTGAHEAPLVVAMTDSESPYVTELTKGRVGYRRDFTSAPGQTEVKSITVVRPPVFDGHSRGPEHRFAYQEATLVIASDEAVRDMTKSAHDALMSWVRLGGTLALVDAGNSTFADVPHVAGRSIDVGQGHVMTLPRELTPAAREAVEEAIRAALESPHAGIMTPSARGADSDSMRRALDPNEHFRPAVGLAALVLVVYALVVGPVLFRRARKRGKPLEVLLTVPAASAVAFGLIVSIGLVTKGVQARSRRLTFVELGSGTSVGPSRVTRAFYSPSAATIDVAPSGPGALPRRASSAGGSDEVNTLSYAGDKSVLQGVTLPPWQTVLTIDESQTSLDGAITLAGGAVTNDTPYALRDVVVRTEGAQCVYFSEISAHQSSPLSGGATRPCNAEAFYSWDVTASVPSERRASAEVTWSAVAAQSSDQLLLPPARAGLVAEVFGMKGPSEDSGLEVESSRTLVRVVAGGAP